MEALHLVFGWFVGFLLCFFFCLVCCLVWGIGRFFTLVFFLVFLFCFGWFIFILVVIDSLLSTDVSRRVRFVTGAARHV